jgi:uncharacterized protein YyaL (SSP411 family)
VDWYPWGPEALKKAREQDKPIFLSIGYSACHWCHVMERESFQNPKVADILNKVFVCIKVDREERPDIDALYLKSVILMTGNGGWPASVWLTPDLKPFYGGTYFPPSPRAGQPSFVQVLLLLASAWRDKREEVTAQAGELMQAVGRLSEVAELPSVTGDWLDKAVAVCRAQYDEKFGGFGEAPKFPQAMTLRFLLLRATAKSDSKLMKLVDHSAEEMARGGIYDQLGGGFHRYSVDAEWTVPHFEKMLYDNALLLGLYSELAASTGKPFYRRLVESLVAWLEEEMLLPCGGFACSTDADSGEGEGRYFVWAASDLEELSKEERALFCKFYGVTTLGNFEEGLNVLTQRQELEDVARELWLKPEHAGAVLASAREKATRARRQRQAPARDDKAVASWNALTVSALCRAAREAGLSAAERLARQTGEFLLRHFAANPEGEIRRLVLSEQSEGVAQGEDVGALVLAFLDLYELTLEDRWLASALSLYDVLLRDYWDETRGLTAMTNPRQSDLPLRPYSFEDNATPSAHSLLLECARRHHRLTGEARSKAVWEKAMSTVAAIAQRAPTGLGLALQSAALDEMESRSLIFGGSAEQAMPFLGTLQNRFLPGLLLARAESEGLSRELTQDKLPGRAYLCSGNRCHPPAEDPRALADQLSAVPATT